MNCCRSLRGSPVIAATNALLSIGSNCLLLVKGLVIGMDIASACADYADECSKYYKKSQSLIVKLRKEVEFDILSLRSPGHTNYYFLKRDLLEFSYQFKLIFVQ